MTVRWKRIAIASGFLSLVLGARVQAQQPAASPNQQAADAVATALRSTSKLAGVRIEIETRDGQATLSGTVKSAAQKSEALNRAMKAAGVKNVVDRLQVVGDTKIKRAQYQVAAGGGGLFHHRGASEAGGEPMMGGAPGMGAQGGPGGYYDPSAAGGPAPEGPAALTGAGGAPNLPNYAWPSYAPYPNFSAVGYPTAYPWQAWPNIGPPSPYPEVPLDWRAVTLRWDDGIWWLDFKKHYTRPFFTPYPFGILAY